MASRNHRRIKNFLRGNPDIALTTAELIPVVYPDDAAAIQDRNRRNALMTTLRRMDFPGGWTICANANPALPHILFNEESAASVAAMRRILNGKPK